MLILRIEYLSGRSIATAYNDRDQAEWPPHPARVFSTLVATWALNELSCADERNALDWLARQGAPDIFATSASQRSVLTHFVPVNDISVLKGRDDTASDKNKRQQQTISAALKSAIEQGDTILEKKRRAELQKREKEAQRLEKRASEELAEDTAPPGNKRPAKNALENAPQILPDHRVKQPRTFPSVTPDDPQVYFRWNIDTSEEVAKNHIQSLSNIAERVVNIGHSSSFVSCSIVDDCPLPNLQPKSDGRTVLRIPGPEQVDQLLESYRRHGGTEPRVLPCRFQRYSNTKEKTSFSPYQSVFSDDWVILRQVGGTRLSTTLGVEIATALRSALMVYSEQPPPELLSGHDRESKPTTHPHLALVPLPFVGHRYASGENLGVALVFPRSAEAEDRRSVLLALHRWESEQRECHEDPENDNPSLPLLLGHRGVMELERVEWGHAIQKTLRSSTWCQHSTHWRTATPIALDRNPGNLFSKNPKESQAAYESAESIVATSCTYIGLPTPCRVEIHPSVTMQGVRKARAFSPFPRSPHKSRRVLVHASLEFESPVEGPLLLGSGRYYGLGLCRPIFYATT